MRTAYPFSQSQYTTGVLRCMWDDGWRMNKQQKLEHQINKEYEIG
jgi:hypothetical protein